MATKDKAEVGTRDHTYQQKLQDEIEKLRPLKERSMALEQQLKAAQRYEKEYHEAIVENMQLKTEIVSLKAEVREQVIPRADDLSDPKDEASKLKAQVKKKDQAISKFQAELKASQEAMKELNRMREHSKKQSREIMYLKQEQAAFKASEEEHSEYEQSLIDSVRNLQDENRKLQDELQGANRDRGYLKEALEAATTRKEELVIQVQMLEAQVEDISPKEESARKQLKSLNDSYRKMQQQHQEMKTENQTLLTQIENLSTLSEEAVLVKLKIGELQDQISLLRKLKEGLLDDVEAAKAEAQVYKEDFEKERRDRAEAFGKMDDLRKQHDEEKYQLKTQVTDVEAQNVRLIEAMSGVRSELEKLKQENAKLSKEIQRLTKENQKVAKRKKSDRSLTESQLAKTESLFEKERNENENLRADLCKALAERNELYQENIQLKQRLESLPLPPRTSLAEMETQHRRSLDQLQALERQVVDGSAGQPSGEEFWRVSPKDVVMEQRILGTGAWGYVAEGRFRGKKVAVKCLHRCIIDPHTIQRVQREVRTMAHVRHPNLLLFIAAVYEPGNAPMIVTELLDVDLRTAYETGRLQVSSKLVIFRDIACALNYLHQHRDPIIHRDVSAPNVLLEALANGVWKAKLSDFGSANLMKYSQTLGEGAIIYSAPETFPQPRGQAASLAPRPPQTTKIDVYSYGVLLCEVITSQLPDPEKYDDMVKQVQRNWLLMYNIITSCSSGDPTKRPTMIEILNELNKIPQPQTSIPRNQ